MIVPPTKAAAKPESFAHICKCFYAQAGIQGEKHRLAIR
jgi:hypothetical protein